VRHSAWLAAVPEAAAHEKQQRTSRLERLRELHKDPDYQPDMPSVEGAAYLLGYLFDVGPVLAAGMGPGPITYTELAAWCQLHSIELEPWEVQFMRRLSFEYLNELRAAEQPDRPAPWGVVRAQFTATNMRAQIAALANL